MNQIHSGMHLSIRFAVIVGSLCLILIGLFTPVIAVTGLSTPHSESSETTTIPNSMAPPACTTCNKTNRPIEQPSLIYNKDALFIRLRSGVFDPLQGDRVNGDGTQNPEIASNPTLHLIQFFGPIQERWYQAMIESRIEVIAYIPDYTYLVWGNDTTINKVRASVPVRWSGSFQPQDALHPKLEARHLSQKHVDIAVQLFNNEDAERTITALTSRAVKSLRPATVIKHYITIALKIAAADLPWIAAQPGVVSVEPLLSPRLLDEIQGQILAGQVSANGSQPNVPGYLSWLTATLGFTTASGAYPIIDITDDGIDDGDETPDHADFYEFGDINLDDRLIYNVNWTGDPTADGVGGHGNLNASIAGGYNDRSGSAFEDNAGYNYGLGINPFARLAGSKVFGNESGWAYPVYADVIALGYQQGTRISSNSWGDDIGFGQYQIDDQIFDILVRDAVQNLAGNQEITILFSAGNSGPTHTSIGSPGNAKNVITVGASESFRPTWIDGCGIGPWGADNANDIASFSSRGPTTDGRSKPEIVAPGTHIVGAATQIPDYTGAYVCDRYYPPNQSIYAASSGTSHATPAVAGATSLFYHYYKVTYSDRNTWPSPAMTKAAIINSAQYLNGAGSGDTLPSPNQGYGAVNLGNVFDGVPRLVEDQTDIFQSSGEETTIRGYISDATKPFRVTLVWTDAPGSVIGDAYVNNLDLVVKVLDQTFLGNVFSGATSVIGGSADTRNNVESVFLPTSISGPFEITIQARNIAGDGVPANEDPTDQDYALMCYNCMRADVFNIDVEPLAHTLCAGESALYHVNSTNYTTRPLTMTLTVSGVPTSSSSIFNPNPILAGHVSSLTVNTIPQTNAGTYNLAITGKTVTRTQTVNAQLRMFESRPQSTTLVSPVDSAIDIPVQPILNWLPSPQAEFYTVEIATDTQFSNLVYSAVTDDTSHTVHTPLQFNTTYQWRIIPENACGTAVVSNSRSLTTRLAPFTISRSPELPIPDYSSGPSGISDTMIITDAGTLIDIDVGISITHSWVGDLRVSLEHAETGTKVDLIDRPGYPESLFGCAGADFDLVLDDAAPLTVEDNCQDNAFAYPYNKRYRPNQPLVAFAGEAWKGTWTLSVSDLAATDSGILHQWSLIPSLSSNTESAVSFSQDTFTVTKTAYAAVLTVTLGSTPPTTVTVDYMTEPASAVPGADYLTSTGTLTFVHTPLQTFLIPILDNPNNVVSRTLTVSLRNPVNTKIVEPSTVPLHIVAEKPTFYFYLQFILKRYP